MKVKLAEGRPASEADIDILEKILGKPLPGDFREFLLAQDGAEPDTNSFKVGDENNSGVNGFIPAHDIPGEMACIDDLPTRAFPIAWAEGGNYVLISLAANGSVLFWDHEAPDVTIKLSNNFTEFLDSLESLDINSIELKPDQVKEAWIDPDFLKRFGEE